MTTVPPLVSIIVRTVGRPELTEALASIAVQSHTNIETLIVDARGDGLPSLQLSAGQTLVSTGAPLGRPKAANAGLDAVSGEFVMFLDDDDWLSASHVENLVHELQSSPTSIAATPSFAELPPAIPDVLVAATKTVPDESILSLSVGDAEPSSVVLIIIRH